VPALDAASLRTARGSTLLFGAGIAAVVLIGLFPGLRPAYDVPVSGAVESDQVSMSAAIMIIMIALSGLMMMCFTVSPQAALKGTIMRSGVTAMICIIGLSWLGSSFFEGNRAVLVGGISDLVRLHPWMFAVSLFLMSFMLFSAAASVSILVPVGVALGMPAWQLIGFYPAAAGNFFLPTYGTLLAAVSFDGTGTTTVGTYLVNHSFMRPGLVTMVSATIIGLALSSVLLR
jgi:anaerobic C4-dicarboxylate transporter DcuA